MNSANRVRFAAGRPRGSGGDAGPLFYSTQIPVCLWFLTRDKRGLTLAKRSGAGSVPLRREAGSVPFCRDRRGETLFIDARMMGSLVDRTHRELTDEDLAKIAGTYHAWRGDKPVRPEPVEGRTVYEDIPGFSRSAKLDDIRKHGHVLRPAATSAPRRSRTTANRCREDAALDHDARESIRGVAPSGEGDPQESQGARLWRLSSPQNIRLDLTAAR